MFQVMRGSAQEGQTPTVVVEFDFFWPGDERREGAAIIIQTAWRAYVAARNYAYLKHAASTASTQCAPAAPVLYKCTQSGRPEG